MKLKISQTEFNNQPVLNRYFLIRWQELKKREVTPFWRRDEMDEVLIALGGNFKTDTSLERQRSDGESTFFNNVLDMSEYLLAWDGGEPIDIVFYKLNEKLRRTITAHITSKSL